MAQLKDISGGLVSSTGTISCPSRICGGVAIVADGTNTGTVVLRQETSSGQYILSFQTKTPITIFAPFEASSTIYYSITGTGCSAQIFSWEQKTS